MLPRRAQELIAAADGEPASTDLVGGNLSNSPRRLDQATATPAFLIAVGSAHVDVGVDLKQDKPPFLMFEYKKGGCPPCAFPTNCAMSFPIKRC